jgi:hypothetical protein
MPGKVGFQRKTTGTTGMDQNPRGDRCVSPARGRKRFAQNEIDGSDTA